MIYYRPTWPWIVVAALLIVAGYFTKQVVSVFAPMLGLYLLWRNWRHALLFGAVVAVIGVAATWLYNRSTDGWFWTYIFQGHQGHLFYWKNILMEYWRDVLFLAPSVLLIPLLWFRYRIPVTVVIILIAAHWTYAFMFRAMTLDYVPHMYFRELAYESPRWLILVPPLVIASFLFLYRLRNRSLTLHIHVYWLLMFVAGVGASGLNHSTQWAYANCFIPIAAFGSLFVALISRDLMVEAPGEPAPRWTPLIPAAILLQLTALMFDPRAQVPGASDRAALADFEAALDEIEGPVFIPAHPLVSYHRDGSIHVHQMGIQDVAFMGGVKDLSARLAKREWAAVIVDDQNQVPGLARHYRVKKRLAWKDEDALRAKTGFRVRPAVIWVPR